MNNWISYWSDKTSTLHAEDNPNFYHDLAREVLYHCGDLSGKRVLELGCGDGALFEFLGIDSAKYTGVDFSPALLSRFRNRHGEIDLHQEDLLGFLEKCGGEYDIIFSYGVLQYLAPGDVKALFNMQRRLLSNGGKCVHLGIPVSEMRGVFHSGLGSSEAIGGSRRTLLKKVKSWIMSRIGYWHDIPSLFEKSNAAGFDTRVVSNIYYLYRVNIIQSI